MSQTRIAPSWSAEAIRRPSGLKASPRDWVGVSPEEANGSAARRVPEPDDHVIAGRGDPPAVGAVRHGANLVGVSCEGQEFPGGRFRDR